MKKKPKQSSELFGFLFGNGEELAFRRLSEGITAMLVNAGSILDDAALLAEAKRFERASFLIATAQEEIGKAYILQDMCRVDARQQDVLCHLCRSFYRHILKYVYFEFSTIQNAGLRELSEVQDYFRVRAQDWWPSEPESGEPDMPHDLYFRREANLYVDVDTYADIWVAPEETKFLEIYVTGPLDRAHESLRKLCATQALKLYEPEALQLFNDTTKRLRVNEKTSVNDLLNIYHAAARELEKYGVPTSDFERSELHNWPLYWIKL